MAERRQVEELLRRVQELSDAISAPSTFSNVDAEVSRAFRPIGTASGNLGNSREVSVLPASAATSASSSQSPRFAFRRNFSNDGSRVFLRKSKAKTAIPKGPFLRDVVLALQCVIDTRAVPRGRKALETSASTLENVEGVLIVSSYNS